MIMFSKLSTFRAFALRFIKENRRLLLTLMFGTVLVDGLLVSVKSDLIFFSLLALYIFFIRMYRLKSNTTFAFCVAVLLVMYTSFLMTGTGVATEKLAVWLVLFMTVGII